MTALVVAVNQEYVDMSVAREWRHTDEVAIIPPLSGG